MKVQIGGFGEPTQTLDVPRLMFVVGDDSRTMFEVWLGKDGVSLEISGCGVCKVNGVLYDSRFSVHPDAANKVTIRAVEYRA